MQTKYIKEIINMQSVIQVFMIMLQFLSVFLNKFIILLFKIVKS